MLMHPTIDQLNALKLTGMVKARNFSINPCVI